MTRKRDPERRRREIVDAAVEVIADVGTGRATHRAIAERAAVPLGSTTYYFPTLDDLVAAALERVAESSRALLDEWRRELEAADDLAAKLAELIHAYVTASPEQARLDYDLYLAAARSPALEAVARSWLDELTAVLAPRTGEEAAAAIAAFVDGATLQAIVTRTPPDRGRLARAIARLAGATSTP